MEKIEVFFFDSWEAENSALISELLRKIAVLSITCETQRNSVLLSNRFLNGNCEYSTNNDCSRIFLGKLNRFVGIARLETCTCPLARNFLHISPQITTNFHLPSYRRDTKIHIVYVSQLRIQLIP